MSTASERRTKWLQALLDKKDVKDLPLEDRLVVIRFLILECQKYGVERILKRSRTPLRWWKIISWAVAILRLVCAFNLLYIFWQIRVHHISDITDISMHPYNFTLKMIHQGLSLLIFFALAFIVIDLLLIITFQIQRSLLITYTYALDFVLVIFVITSGPFLAAARAYSYELVSDIYAYTLFINDVSFRDIEYMHHNYKCCGFAHTTDWTSKNLYNVTTLFTNDWIIHPNNFDWMSYCVNRTSASCYLPQFCCSEPGCQRLPNNDTAFGQNLIHYQMNYDDPYNYYHSHLRKIPKVPGTYETACFRRIADGVNQDTIRTWKWLIALIILTLIMTLLVIVILLYNSGQGELMPNINRVRSPHCSPLVWFFIKLDQRKKKLDDDLSDFSLVEELMNFDIDRDATEME